MWERDKERGSEVILSHTGSIIWSANSSRSVREPVALLLDSGNFVLRDLEDASSERMCGKELRREGARKATRNGANGALDVDSLLQMKTTSSGL